VIIALGVYPNFILHRTQNGTVSSLVEVKAAQGQLSAIK